MQATHGFEGHSLRARRHCLGMHDARQQMPRCRSVDAVSTERHEPPAEKFPASAAAKVSQLLGAVLAALRCRIVSAGRRDAGVGLDIRLRRYGLAQAGAKLGRRRR